MYLKDSIYGKIYGDYIRDWERRKPFNKSMSQLIKYLDYLYCNLVDPYLITQKSNWFSVDISDAVKWASYAERMRTKS